MSGLRPLALVLVWLGVASPAGHTLTWDEIETVDGPVAEISNAAGSCITVGAGVWYATYVKEDIVYVATRDASGVWAPEALTSGSGSPTSPQLTFAAGTLHVIWESDQSGHDELYTRRHDGAGWSAESCLTCDAVPSRAGVLAGDKLPWDATDYVLAAWEDGAPGATEVLARVFHDGAWGTVETVSDSPGNATEPSAAAYDGAVFLVAWTDDRNGDTDIYTSARAWDGTWGASINRTDTVTGSAAHPAVTYEPCCLDVVVDRAVVVFERSSGGVFLDGRTFEIFDSLSEPFPLNNIGDQYADVSGFGWIQGGSCGFFGGALDRYVVATTSRLAPGSRAHALEYVGESGSQMFYHSATGLDRMVVCGAEGKPDAGVMALWTEERDGTPTLLARLGSTSGGSDLGLLDHPRALVIDPEGVIANTLTLGDEYSGIPAGPDWELGLMFDPALAAALRFDTDTPPFFETTDVDGQAVFYIRGGGCSQAGDVDVTCGPVLEASGLWNGVKSPDIDGNCFVELDDIEYMTSMLGTDDFCADLDGSGVVDTADLSLAMSAYQDRCVTVSVDDAELPAMPPAARLTAAPNPVRDVALLRVDVAAPGSARIFVVDIAGRMVRDLGRHELARPRTIVTWDARDSGGREVSTGEYIVVVQLDDGRIAERLTVLR